MNGYCDSCGKLIMNDASVAYLKNGKVVTVLCLECDEKMEGMEDGNKHTTADKKTTDTGGQRVHEKGDQ